jgi:hypothetical protein
MLIIDFFVVRPHGNDYRLLLVFTFIPTIFGLYMRYQLT